MQSSAPYVTVESNRVMPAQLSDGRASCVVRSFQIYEWVRSDLASHKQTTGVFCYLKVHVP